MDRMARSLPYRLPRQFINLLRLGLQIMLYFLIKLRLLWIILVAFFLLSGCVRYTVGITFADTNHGAIVQHIRLKQQLRGISGSVATVWLDSLEQQAQSLGGRSQRPSAEEWVITVPFYNAKDLEAKFNQLLQPKTKQDGRSLQSASTNLPQPISSLRLHSNNLFLWQRNRLDYDLDLRSLETFAAVGNPLIRPDNPLELEFSLNTPWGAKIVESSSLASGDRQPGKQQSEKQLNWKLKPGEINHLEAVFWVPSPLGIGAALIALLVAGGMVWQRGRSPQSAGLPTAP